MARPAISADKHTFYRKLPGPLMVAAGTFYLVFHVLMGEHGLYALLKEQRKLEILTSDIATLESQRATLANRVRLLSPGSLDLDMLDERSRLMLNDARPDEVVIPLKPGESLPQVPQDN
jgi:cell division protein FtsB